MNKNTVRERREFHQVEMARIFKLSQSDLSKNESLYSRFPMPAGMDMVELKTSMSKSLSFRSFKSLRLWKVVFIKNEAVTEMCIDVYWWTLSHLFDGSRVPEMTYLIGLRSSKQYVKVLRKLLHLPLKIQDEFLNALPDGISRVAYKMMQTTQGKTSSKPLVSLLIRQCCLWFIGSIPAGASYGWNTWRSSRNHNNSAISSLMDDSDDRISEDDMGSSSSEEDDTTDSLMMVVRRKKDSKRQNRYRLQHSPFIHQYLTETSQQSLSPSPLSIVLTEPTRFSTHAGGSSSMTIRIKCNPLFVLQKSISTPSLPPLLPRNISTHKSISKSTKLKSKHHHNRRNRLSALLNSTEEKKILKIHQRGRRDLQPLQLK